MTKETKKGTPPSHSINHVVELDEDKALYMLTAPQRVRALSISQASNVRDLRLMR